MPNHFLNTELFDKAAHFAISAHANTERRAKGFPYIIHPMEAAAIVATMTTDPELLAAAILHDTLEDTEVTFEELRSQFGNRVAYLVLAESNIKMNGILRQTTWRESKSRAVERLANASHEGKIVAMGDKLSNLRAIASDYQLIGDQLWSRFHAPEGKKDVEWYYRALFDALNDLKGTLPYQEFERLIRQTWGEKKE
jgi:myo-inositol-1(or 4)-monophosphatase